MGLQIVEQVRARTVRAGRGPGVTVWDRTSLVGRVTRKRVENHTFHVDGSQAERECDCAYGPIC